MEEKDDIATVDQLAFPDAESNALMRDWLPVQEALDNELEGTRKRLRALARMSRAENTDRAYRAALRPYYAWCHGLGFQPLSGDPGIIAHYLAMLSEKVLPSTLRARLAAISTAHRLAGKKLDTKHVAIQLTMHGAAREKGLAPRRQARALHYRALPALMDTFSNGHLDVRNKALILTGFAGALRRSEIAHLMLDYVAIDKDGMTLNLPRSKADRVGRGEIVYITPHPNGRLCPVVAMQAWLTLRGEAAGPLFLRANRNGTFRATGISEITVNRTIKTMVEKLGFDPSAYSGHSLRAGLATSAADAGVDLKAIMTQTRLKSAKQAMTYIRDAERRRKSLTASLFQQQPLGLE